MFKGGGSIVRNVTLFLPPQVPFASVLDFLCLLLELQICGKVLIYIISTPQIME